jgi:hypothetical protein
MRSEEFDELSQRFQTDAHEVVDVFLNVVTTAPDIINRLHKSTSILARQSSGETTDSETS